MLAAAEHGGFRRAARRLGVQQSAVSRRIHELEERLGARIFERGPSGVCLTSAGQAFVDGALGAVSSLDHAVEQLADVAQRQEGVLRIGLAGPIGAGRLERLLRQVLDRDPRLALDLIDGAAADHLAELVQGRLDLAFLPFAPERLASRPAWRERILVALPAGHRLAARPSLRWKDLSGQRLLLAADMAQMIGDPVARAGKAGLGLAISAQSTTCGTAIRLAVLGQGLALVSESAASPAAGLVYRPVWRALVTYHAVLGRRREKRAVTRLLALLPPAS